MAYRSHKVAQEMRQEISAIIARELRDPRVGFATVTEAKVSADLSHAQIFISVLGSPQQQRETLDSLNRAAGYIRRLLGPRLRLRRMPELSFVFDQSIEQGARMMQIIEEIRKETSEPESQTSDPRPPTSDL
jgi:ribosome-binding factor A